MSSTISTMQSYILDRANVILSSQENNSHSLTKDQIVSIVYYMAEGSYAINKDLVDNQGNLDNLSENNKIISTDLLNGLNNLTAQGKIYQGEVKKGVARYYLDKDYKIGETFTAPAFLSTTANTEIDIDNTAQDKELVFIIESKKGIKISDYAKSDWIKAENEILFKPNTQFKILNINSEKGHIQDYPDVTAKVIKMQEIINE